MKRVVALTGAGISAESGLKTFRDSGGLWEGYRVEEVATPEAWRRNPELVLEFYNQRRRDLIRAEPNAGHRALAELQSLFEVIVVTQNVDDLHERAGSRSVLHLHGELRKSRSTKDPALVYDIGGTELRLGDYCELGAQLRPHIVWFGEMVPELERAAALVRSADAVVIVGTSMVVYPAAGLLFEAKRQCPKLVVDPVPPAVDPIPGLEFIAEKASTGVLEAVERLTRLL